MIRDQARLNRLKRLERIRGIARHDAQARAAAAEAQLRRHVELAQRSDDLARAFAHRWDATDAAGMQQARAFHAGLASVSDATSRDSQQARQAADEQRLDAAAADRRRNLVAEQVGIAARQVGKARSARMAADAPSLARSLNKRMTPPVPSA